MTDTLPIEAWEALDGLSTTQNYQTAGDALVAEVERLRAALETIADHKRFGKNGVEEGDVLVGIARAALARAR